MDDSSESTVTFRHPVILKDFAEPQAPGTYRLVFDTEDIQGLTFTATRRTGIHLQLPALSVSEMATSVVKISQRQLDAMIAEDAAPR